MRKMKEGYIEKIKENYDFDSMLKLIEMIIVISAFEFYSNYFKFISMSYVVFKVLYIILITFDFILMVFIFIQTNSIIRESAKVCKISLNSLDYTDFVYCIIFYVIQFAILYFQFFNVDNFMYFGITSMIFSPARDAIDNIIENFKNTCENLLKYNNVITLKKPEKED